MAQRQEIYDLLLITDATYSMSDYIASLQTSLPQIISLSALTGCFSRIGLLAYRDYCDSKLIEWSGWLDQGCDAEGDQPDLVSRARALEPLGGGDYPEATKTALAKAYEVARVDATTVVILYTDAPPHTDYNGEKANYSYYSNEVTSLSDPMSFGGCGPNFTDWVSACKMLRNGEKPFQVFSLTETMPSPDVSYYNFLCTITGGAAIYLRDSKPVTISKVTIELLLAWMGVEKAGASDAITKEDLPASLTHYMSVDKIRTILDEKDPVAKHFFGVKVEERGSVKLIEDNIVKVVMTPEVLKKHLPKKKTPVTDFAKAWDTDAKYRTVAVEHLKKIINDDVSAMSLNPVFGSLWRAVCNDRTNSARDDLISAFGLQIERIANADEKARMKAWLEESYDYTAEVLEAIERVPEAERFPCVCLDPTLSFTAQEAEGGELAEDEEANKPVTSFTRDELLEIGRSCDHRILRRLGRLLTRLTYIEKATDMPAHIRATSEEDVPKIPIALASQKYGRRFWRILLHIVVPGTMLSARPAALLAALSLRLGFKPLTKAAEHEAIRWQDRWNDISVPENWNTSCLSLLLDADRAYKTGHEEESSEGNNAEQKTSLLKSEDRALFEQLVAFKILELNLDTSLTARVSWTPEKTMVPMGPAVKCRICDYPRSVTIMGKDQTCGICLSEFASSKEQKESTHRHVTRDDQDETLATWVECFIPTCRAQYIVYNPEDLNVRPKCHYCRARGAVAGGGQESGGRNSLSDAPFVECIKCLNRVIWPEAYRPSSFLAAEFHCPACLVGRKTIVDVETSAKKLSAENSVAWLARDSQNPDHSPFTGRTLFYMVSSVVPPDAFLSRISLFPPPSTDEEAAAGSSLLTIRGKQVQNFAELKSTLQGLVSRRHAERAPCSLCFSTFRPNELSAACGRRGCLQRVCRGCLRGWYGLNAPGKLINTAALSCPFCRRRPAGRTLAKYGMGVHAVGGLAEAVAERGQWIHAWCVECGHARRFVERVCAQGAPAQQAEDEGRWRCEECRERTDQLRVRPCPGCGTMTEKTDGCNHIYCTVEGCGAHWCYQCGERFDENTIYDHMSSAHGGYYDHDYESEDHDYESEDDGWNRPGM